MKIKMIALDLDRTTLNRNGRLSDENRKVLTELLNRGIHVIPASGRSLTSFPQEILTLPGLKYVITSNGAAVYANSHFPRPAGPHFPASQGHIKRSALEIGRARGAPPC